MTKNANGDFVIRAKTIRMLAAIVAAIGVLGPTLGVGVAWIVRDVNRDNDIATLKERVTEINGALDRRLEKIEGKLTSIEEYLRK